MTSPTIIDSLVNSIERFGISQNENRFNSELDDLMGKMGTVNIHEIEHEEIEWEHLKNNYSKLKYLYEIVNYYNVPTEGKFIQSLSLFMESIDAKSQFYLREIDWINSDPSIKTEAICIKDLFGKSLNENDPIDKMNSVLQAYKILIPIIETYRNESSTTKLDPAFLETFRTPKRLKK